MDINNILKIISCDKYLYDEVIYRKELIKKDILEPCESIKRIFPCDVVALRKHLEYGYITDNPLLLYSLKFGRKYLRKYPIFLIFDLKETDLEYEETGQLIKMEYDKFPIGGSLKRLLINTPTYENVISDVVQILRDTSTKIAVSEDKSIN